MAVDALTDLPESGAPVALVNMPWASVTTPAISLAILKSCLRAHGLASDVLHLNIAFARLLDNLAFYEAVPTAGLVGELCFAPHVFDTRDADAGSSTSPAGMPDDPAIRGKLRAGLLSRWSDADWRRITRELVPRFLVDCISRINWTCYAVVGFTTTFAQTASTLLLARRLKERFPRMFVVLGGANVSGPMGPALLEGIAWIDAVVDGEAERTFPELVKNVLSGDPYRPLAGVSFRTSEGIALHQGPPAPLPLDESPIPDYDDYFAQLSEEGLTGAFVPRLLLETSRGCWCTGSRSTGQFVPLLGRDLTGALPPSPRRLIPHPEW